LGIPPIRLNGRTSSLARMKTLRSKGKSRSTADAGLVGGGLEAAELLDEIERYLAAVDLFRALGCEPTWRGQEAWASPVGSVT
jgi:hypothetical protein